MAYDIPGEIRAIMREKQTFEPLSYECKIGFEFEYVGIELDECAQILKDIFDGDVKQTGPLSRTLKNSRLGDLKIEEDWHFAQKLANLDEPNIPKRLLALIHEGGEQLGKASTQFVPWEIVTVPLTYDQLPLLEKMRQRLKEGGAEGTHRHMMSAFGTHINPQIPNDDVKTCLSYLRSFILLYPTLLEELDIDPTRRLLTYIDPFPQQYAAKILREDYEPDWDHFIQDYLKDNPTRNRALDLLPLLAHIDPKVTDQLKNSSKALVKPRPTFHYRLPNCEFDNPDWRVAQVFNSWVAVAKLANDPENLAALSRDYLYHLRHPIFQKFKDGWQLLRAFVKKNLLGDRK